MTELVIVITLAAMLGASVKISEVIVKGPFGRS